MESELSPFPHKIAKYFEIAKNAAKNATFKHRHGAVLVKGGNIINVSFNEDCLSSFASRFINHSMFWKGRRHAEVNCVLGVSKNCTDGAILYVVRINAAEELRNSKPCEMCAAVMSFVGIKRVFFSIDETTYGVQKL